jgi:lysophospholipase L1-like esterase
MHSNAQSVKEYIKWNPASDSTKVLEGQGWTGEVNNFYDRLPARAEKMVSEGIWKLASQTAGLQLRFRTNADEIIIRYIVGGNIQMPHMPATGVSGIDLYSKNIDGNWNWAAGRFSFGDTITYQFSNLVTNDQHVKNRDYTLYLPLYNSVKWMEISVPKPSLFTPLPKRIDRPIIVYGTSIAQGACATRPGLVWSSILSRKLDLPVINLGFSGSGRLDPPIVGLIGEVNAKLYVLDCLPNLVAPGISSEELYKRIVAAVGQLKKKNPTIPILLTEHDGYTDEEMNPTSKKQYADANKVLKKVFDSLTTAGVKNIFLLSKEQINQDIESTIDRVHPNDIGMMNYANAYEIKIREIFNMAVGKSSTTIPITQRRDANTYDWETRHKEILIYNTSHSPQLLFIGNSITHFWGGIPTSDVRNGSDSWNKYFEKKNAINLGFGWDRIENVLWRVYNGELDNIAPSQIVIMIGTNNLDFNSNNEIREGLKFLINAISAKQPNAKILLMGILPRRNMEDRINLLNKLISTIPFNKRIKYANASKVFLQPSGKIDESLFSDGLHPNTVGYEKLGAFINTQIGK